MHIKIGIRLVCIALFVHMILQSSCCSGWIFNTAFIKICTPPKKKLPNHVPTGQLDSEYICSFDCTISFTCMSCVIALRFDILMVSMNYRLSVPAHLVAITDPAKSSPWHMSSCFFRACQSVQGTAWPRNLTVLAASVSAAGAVAIKSTNSRLFVAKKARPI